MFVAFIFAAMVIAPLIPGSKAQIFEDNNNLWIEALVFGAASYFFFNLGGGKLTLKTVFVVMAVILTGFFSELIESAFGGKRGIFFLL